MAKKTKKATKEASNLFQNIIKASVKPTTKPMPDMDDTMKMYNNIVEEIKMVVPDYGNYVAIQINTTTRSIWYNIDQDCPIYKRDKIEKAIFDNVALMGITASTKRDY